MNDLTLVVIDTGHILPSHTASTRPNAIVCKFVGRLAKEKVMAARREDRNTRVSYTRVSINSPTATTTPECMDTGHSE